MLLGSLYCKILTARFGNKGFGQFVHLILHKPTTKPFHTKSCFLRPCCPAHVQRHYLVFGPGLSIRTTHELQFSKFLVLGVDAHNYSFTGRRTLHWSTRILVQRKHVNVMYFVISINSHFMRLPAQCFRMGFLTCDETICQHWFR